MDRRFRVSIEDKLVDLAATVAMDDEAELSLNSTNRPYREPFSGWYWLISTPQGERHASLSRQSGVLTIAVDDDGSGIPEDATDQVSRIGVRLD